MRRLALILWASCSLCFQSGWAQSRAVTWTPLSRLSASSLYSDRPHTPLSPRDIAHEVADTVPKQIPPTHWVEGGIIGGIALGAFGIWLGHGLCQDTDAGSEPGCTAKAVIGGGIVGGGIGFLLGALIGGQFPKNSPSGPSE
jgi:hypothetical protein